LELNPDCAPALILLAEEDCQTLTDAEELLRFVNYIMVCSCFEKIVSFRRALKSAEIAYRRSQASFQYDPDSAESEYTFINENILVST
jgi:hypothetical protein